MLATNGPRWYDRREPDPGWSSFAVSVGLTLALFASAFVAMRTVPRWISAPPTDRERSTIVRLTPPAAVPRPQPPPEPTRIDRAPRPAPQAPRLETPPARTAVPAPPPISIAPPQAPPATSPSPRAAPLTNGVPIGIVRDTTGRGNQPVMGRRGGAPVAPSGLTIGDRVKNTPAYRDSMARLVLGSIPQLAKLPPTTAEKQELEASKQAGRVLVRRQTTAGNPNVHVMEGEGRGGEGAVGGQSGGVSAGPGSVTVSVPFPLFSPGPSPEQRKKNEALEKDYSQRLGRLNDRLLLIRDSIRADSLRRDSLRRDSLRRDSLAKARKPVP